MFLSFFSAHFFPVSLILLRLSSVESPLILVSSSPKIDSLEILENPIVPVFSSLAIKSKISFELEALLIIIVMSSF